MRNSPRTHISSYDAVHCISSPDNLSRSALLDTIISIISGSLRKRCKWGLSPPDIVLLNQLIPLLVVSRFTLLSFEAGLDVHRRSVSSVHASDHGAGRAYRIGAYFYPIRIAILTFHEHLSVVGRSEVSAAGISLYGQICLDRSVRDTQCVEIAPALTCKVLIRS